MCSYTGPVVRVSPYLLSFSDPKLLPVIYHRAADKAPVYGAGALGKVSSTFSIRDHHEHALRRRKVAQSVSSGSMQYS